MKATKRPTFTEFKKKALQNKEVKKSITRLSLFLPSKSNL
ncbi:hypothetical protein NNO_0793 [Hydrogenimonas sp.]|nr:hypothetical protein NNO_0793 [Hydrogenimonas sp.]